MSDCNVCIDFGGEQADEFEQFEVKTNRPYRCSECSEIMPTGTLHQLTMMTIEGEKQNWRTCLICAEIRTAFSCGGEVVGGVFWKTFAESSFDEFTTGCLERLETPAAKAFILERWRHWKGLSA